MAKQALVLNKFTGGLNSYSDPRDLKEDEFQVLDNACVDEQGVIRVAGSFNASNNMDGVDFRKYTDYQNSMHYSDIPIAGKGFYSFMLDIDTEDTQFDISSGILVNPTLEDSNTGTQTNGSQTLSGWYIKESDGSWNFSQTETYNTLEPMSHYHVDEDSIKGDIEKSATNWVLMSNTVDGTGTATSDGLYKPGWIRQGNIHLKPGNKYTIVLCCTSDRPWYWNGYGTPPRLQLYNENIADSSGGTTGRYLDGDGNFKDKASLDIAYLRGLLSPTSGQNAIKNSLMLGGSSFDWARIGDTHNDTLVARKLNKSFFDNLVDGDAWADWLSTDGNDADWKKIQLRKFSQGMVGGVTSVSADGDLGNYVLEFTSASDSGHHGRAGNSLFASNNIVNGIKEGQGFKIANIPISDTDSTTVNYSTKYIFDIFTLRTPDTENYASYWTICFYQNNSGTLTELAHYDMGEGDQWFRASNAITWNNMPLPFEFSTQDSTKGNTIEIHIGTRGSGNTAWFKAMNLRRKSLELGTVVRNFTADQYPYSSNKAMFHPNTWSADSSTYELADTYDASADSGHGYIQSRTTCQWEYSPTEPNKTLKGLKKYEYTFTVPPNFPESNEWVVGYNSGIWGSIQSSAYANIILNYFNIHENTNQNMTENNFGGYSLFNFINYNPQSYEDRWTALQVNRKIVNKNYQSNTEYMNQSLKEIDVDFPGSSTTFNFYFLRGSKKIFFCDDSFARKKSLYQFYWNTDKKTYKLEEVNFSGPDITHISSQDTISYLIAVNNARGASSTIRDYINVIQSTYDLQFAVLNPNAVKFNQVNLHSDGDEGGKFDFIEHMGNINIMSENDADGNARSNYIKISYFMEKFCSLVEMDSYQERDSGLGHTFKHDMDGSSTPSHVDNNDFNPNYMSDHGWEDQNNPYTKYFVFSADELRNHYNADTRLAKVVVDLEYFAFFGSGGNHYNSYIPNMTIYVDIINDDIINRNADTFHEVGLNAATDNHGLIETIGEINIRDGEPVLASHIVYENKDKYNTSTESNFTENNFGPNEEIPGNQWVYAAASRTMEQDADVNQSDGFVNIYKDSNKAEIVFPAYQKYHTGGQNPDYLDIKSKNNGGIALQIRLVPKIDTSISNYELGVGESGFEPDGHDDTGVKDDDYVKGILRELWRPTNKGIQIFAYDTESMELISNPYANIGLDDLRLSISFGTPSYGAADGWDDEFEFKTTYVDIDGIETAFGKGQEISNTDLTKCPTINLAYHKQRDFGDYKFIKLYAKSSRNPVFNLQAIIDIDKRIIESTTSINSHDGQIITEEENTYLYILPREDLLSPNEVDSYESETGVLQENAEDPALLTALFKTGVIANNILYAGNVYQNKISYPDRMIKSPIGKYPMLPSTNFIDVATNDGDEITCLKFFKDRLLQFKRNRLYIINTSEEYEYLEDTYENLGVKIESQVTETPHGICWINSKGCYLYDGAKINYLIKDRIAYKNWKDSESSWVVSDKYNASIAYLKNEDKLLIFPSTESFKEINSGMDWKVKNKWGQLELTKDKSYSYYKKIGYQYDFNTNSWNNITNVGTNDDRNEDVHKNLDATPFLGKHKLPYPNYRMSNFQYDENNNVCFLASGDNGINYCVWNDSPDNTFNNNERDFRVITKDYDFNSPGVNKKIYKIYVTFKSTIIESNKLIKHKQNQDLYAPSNVRVSYATDGSNTWNEFDASSSTNYSQRYIDLDPPLINGDFQAGDEDTKSGDNLKGWIAGSSSNHSGTNYFEVTSNRCHLVAGSSSSFFNIYQPILIPGKTYKYKVDITTFSAGSVSFGIGGNYTSFSSSDSSPTGTKEFTSTTGGGEGATHLQVKRTGATATNVIFDNIIVQRQSNCLADEDSEIKTVTLDGALSAIDYGPVQITVNSTTNIKVGYVIYIGDIDTTRELIEKEGSFEQMLVRSIDSSTTLTVDRGYNNSEVLYHIDGSQVNISNGNWITAELKPSESINNIKSFKLKFEVDTDSSENTTGVPNGFMINDVTIVYRQKNVK